jgi:hypothetical protein
MEQKNKIYTNSIKFIPIPKTLDVITDRFFQNTFFDLIYLINKVLKNLHEIYLVIVSKYLN